MATSWVIRERATGRVLFETFDAKAVAKLPMVEAGKIVEAVPIAAYLGELNRKIREAA